MKKIYLLCLAMMALFALQVNAQDSEVDNTFQFQDANGNEVKDGTTLLLNKYDAEKKYISTGLFIKNTTFEKVAGNLRIDINNMPNGNFSSCGFGQCLIYKSPQSVDGSNGIIEADAAAFDAFTEWLPDTYGDWTATLQLVVRDLKVETRFGKEVIVAGDIIGYGPKVTLHFVYADPTGINTIDGGNSKKVAAIYSANGARRADMQKGLNIVRYTDGTTAKVLK